ncbi:Growth-regulating factor 1 [Tripterygium wilfordii]|uniref:Growth-regulating factor 1 n=1 Tax=Tripterygium wilfordii TaxID=458696 RepID=A0A7J7D0K7_TRIWF|nr:Growth-regulating factor 1 [Tripterygium wilfordii]
MDFGGVGLDGLVGSDTTSTGFASLASDPETKHRWYGSGLNKQERSGAEDDWRSSKLAKTDHDFSSSKPQQQQMLSFSSPKTEAFSAWRTSQNATTLPYSQLTSSSAYNRNTGYSTLGFNGANMHGTGHSVAATTNITKLTPTTASSSVVVGSNGSGTTNGLAVANQLQLKNLQSGAPSLSAATPFNRTYLNKEKVGDRLQDTSGLSMLSAPIDLKSKDNPFLISRQQNPYGGLQTEFGLVTSNSLLNPSNKGSSLMSCTSFGSSQALADQDTVSQHSLHQFMDDWPKNQSDRSSITWPALDVQSDRTQLSISIPMADFMSSTSSPNNEKVTLSPLRLSREFDPIQMGLGVGSVLHEQNSRQANWIPISWESSVGGPLGEVLHNTSNSAADSKNSSPLNLMTEGWDSSPRMGSSPTGVLQRTTFNSLSNSSAGSSPRPDNNKKTERASMSNDLTGSTVVHSLPAL